MLHVHRAERADALAEGLAELLAVPATDPFTAEIVAVPARGVERWLAQRLSHRLGATADGDGICAGVAFPSPAAVIDGAVLAATGDGDDAWRPERAVWPLLEVIDHAEGEAWCAMLHAYLRGGSGRRYPTVRRLTELFASYAMHRPALLRSWRAGEDADTPPDLRWQAELWRRLRTAVQAGDGNPEPPERPGHPERTHPTGRSDPAERLDAAVTTLAADPAIVDLPPRLSVFGPTRLPEAHLQVLAALAAHREVHLWIPHPSPDLWKRIPVQDRPPRRRDDRSAAVPRHPLLASLGRDVRELQARLPAGALAHHHPGVDPPETMLGRLQRDLRDDRPPVPVAAASGSSDDSIRVHSCHGPTRQVEVLREVVVGLLAADPTLEPRDVLVMCPDIETFAPLITAAFAADASGEPWNAGRAHPGRGLRVRLADRALRQVNPVLDVLARILELADARLTAAQVLDLAGAGPVRTRFGFADEDTDRLRELVGRSGIRWGLDGPDRARFRLDGFGQNTWSAGLDRILTGVTMSADGHGWLGTALPLDDVDSGDVDLVGRLAELVDRLATLRAALNRAQPVTAWIAALIEGLDALTHTAAVDGWQADQARAELAAAARDAGPRAAAVSIGLAEVRALLAHRLRGRPTRANFRTGTLTVATMVPMRSVPHRVICLLGLDDATFPRTGAVDGDDVLARDPVAGERDVRSEDRQLLLDAIGAATERLVVLYTGADARTGARRPPAVPLGELLDTLRATHGETAVAEEIVVAHPLQPFDARNFTPGRLGTPGPFSHDQAELAGALSATAPRRPTGPFLPAPLPPVPDEVCELDELIRFLEHPARAFLRSRVGLPVWAAEEDLGDALPIDPDGLAVWAVGDRLLRDRLAGRDLARCRQAEWRRGDLPPGPLGGAVLDRVLGEVEPLVAAAATVRAGHPGARDVDLTLPGGYRLTGTVTGVVGADGADTILRVEYSKLGPKHRVRAWAQLLALTAAAPGTPVTAVTLGRSWRGGPARAVAGPVPPEVARDVLDDLVGLFREGMCEPLPLGVESGHRYLRCLSGGAEPDGALAEAATAWAGGRFAEAADPFHRRVWGPPDTALVTGSPRFGELARRVWEPLLHHEREGRP